MSPGSTLAARGATALVFWDLVDESLDEAAFLWQRREAALEAHDRTPEDVEGAVEDRLLGAIEGLCAADAEGVERVLDPALQSDDPSLVAVAGHALLVGGTAQGAAGFGAAFLHSAGERLLALRKGLELVATPGTLIGLASSASHAPDAVHAAFLDACAFRALSPGPRFGELLTGTSPALQRAAARLLAHASSVERAVWLPRALALTDRQALEAAVTTALIAGVPGAWTACRGLATADLNASDQMLMPLAMSGRRRDHDLVCGALGQSQRQPGALRALGFGGRRSGADACVELLAQDRHVRLAAEALVAITGLDLNDACVTTAAAAPAANRDEPPTFDDDNLDADLVPSAEDRLPAPDVPRVIRWWNRNRARFDPETRYLGGRPATIGLVVDQLAHGPMRRRGALAFELAVRTQGRFQLETRGFLAGQRRRLATFAAQAFVSPSFDGGGAALSQETSTRDRR